MTSDQATPVALVTGAGRDRIGLRIARALGERGFRLALHCHQSREAAERHADELRENGMEVMVVQANVAEEADVSRMFASIDQRWGRLDVLVTTASIWNPRRLEDVTAEDVLNNFRVNTLGTFLCCQFGGLLMARQPDGGAIVTIGDWAIERPYVDYAPYFISKGALPTLTRTMAVELAARNRNIRVNCIHPGPVLFPPDMSDAEKEATREATLLKTADRPDAVVQAVLFLIENPMTTGVCLPIDAGCTINPLPK